MALFGFRLWYEKIQKHLDNKMRPRQTMNNLFLYKFMNEKNKISKFNVIDYLKYTPIAYAYLLLLGYSYYDSYYTQWDIEIYSYLESMELLLLFMHNIITIIIMFILSIIINLHIIYDRIDINFNPKRKEWIKSLSLKKGVIHWINKNFEIILGAIVILFMLYTYATRRNILSVTIYIELWIFTTFFLLIPITIYILKYLNRINFPLSINKIIIALVITFIFSSNYLYGIYNYKLKINRENYTQFEFSYEGNNYKSSDSLTYIGDISKYIFIRDEGIKINKVFQKNKIKSLNIKYNQHKTNSKKVTIYTYLKNKFTNE